MPDRRGYPLLLGILVAVLVIALDQASKLWVFDHFALGDSVPLTPFLNLVLLLNPGAAFSFLADHTGWQRWFFCSIALGISGWVLWQLRREPKCSWHTLALALIMGGALGNVIDRIWLGMVIDFIDVHVAGWHWPAFNVADSAVCVGALMYVLNQNVSPKN